MQLDFDFSLQQGEQGLDSALIKSLSAEQLRYLFGPIAHQSWGWASSVPEWLLQAVFPARIALVLQECRHGEPQARLATDEEVAIVLFGASLDGPLTPESTEIYCHLVEQLMKKHRPGFVGAGCEVLERHDASLLVTLKTKIRAVVVRKSTYGKKKKNENNHR